MGNKTTKIKMVVKNSNANTTETVTPANEAPFLFQTFQLKPQAPLALPNTTRTENNNRSERSGGSAVASMQRQSMANDEDNAVVVLDQKTKNETTTKNEIAGSVANIFGHVSNAKVKEAEKVAEEEVKEAKKDGPKSTQQRQTKDTTKCKNEKTNNETTFWKPF